MTNVWIFRRLLQQQLMVMESIVPSKCCNFDKLLLKHLGRTWLGWPLCLALMMGCFAAVSVAQETVQPPKANPNLRQGIDRTSLRPSIPESKFTGSTKTIGITSVDLEPGLGRILKGSEPRNQAELISLEKQQTKVAEKVNLVTVNLPHAPR